MVLNFIDFGVKEYFYYTENKIKKHKHPYWNLFMANGSVKKTKTLLPSRLHLFPLKGNMVISL
jgi:hypothetical protein